MKRRRTKQKQPFIIKTSIDTEELIFTPLGSGNEVGRSSHLLEFKGKRILLDCGLHPGKRGGNALPFFDVISPEDVDLALISHFHVDHVASLPYFTEKTKFNGEIYMTRPTRVVSELLLKDYVRIIQNNSSNESDTLYDAKDVFNCLKKCQVVDFHQVVTVQGIRFTPLFAGHVLGAAMFLIEISNVRILYTGDFSCELDRHLIPAEVPSSIQYKESSKALDLLIMESTFGTMVHQSREVRENMFTNFVTGILNRNGVCLIPVFSLGRAQELLLILEDFWKRNPDLHQHKIYHYSHVATKALEVFKTYTNVMNDNIREARKVHNPWEFEYIFPFEQSDSAIDSIISQPSVIMASPGMLQNGLSRRVFEKICNSEKNGVVLCGYSVEGTLAFQLAKDSSLKSFQSAFSNSKLQIKCSIDQVSFAAHSDILGTRDFVNKIKPKNLILVHGDSMQMKRVRKDLGSFFTEQNSQYLFELSEKLKQVRIRQRKEEEVKLDESLEKTLKDEETLLLSQIEQKQNEKIRIFMPHNTQRMILPFKDRRMIKLLGKLSLNRKLFTAQTLKPEEETNLLKLNGYLVRKNFEEILVAKDEVEVYTELSRNVIKQQLFVPFHGSFDDLRKIISTLFEITVEEKEGNEMKVVVVQDIVNIEFYKGKSSVTLCWNVTLESEIVADAVVALLLHSEGSVEAIKRSKCLCSQHKHIADKDMEVEEEGPAEETLKTNEKVTRLFQSLKAWFGEENIIVEQNIETNQLFVKVIPPTDPKQSSEVMIIEEEKNEIAECVLVFDRNCTLVNVTHSKTNLSQSIYEKVIDLVENCLKLTCKV